MNRKTLDAQFAPTARGFTATITTATLDRDGEVVIPQGMDSTEFEANPVLFWNHDYNQPVGKCLGLKRAADGIVGDFVFAERPKGYEGEYFPEFVASLVGQGIVRGVSIGYMPAEGGTRRATPEDRKRFGDTVQTVFSKWKLLEVSVAPLQANPDALVTAISKGAVRLADAKRWLGYAPPPTRHRVEITLPSAEPRSQRKAAPIDCSAIARRELARARGLLY